MRFTILAKLGLPALLFTAACASPNTEGGEGGSNGSGGTTSAGTGGTTTGQGGSTQSSGGATGTGGHTGTGGAVGSGGVTGGTGGVTGATGGITGATGGATGTGGAAGGIGTGGHTGTGGATATGGTTGATGGSTGSAGGASGASNPSGYPFPPGMTNVAQPSGSPGAITVINWAGFKGAVSYNFDDDNDSVISAYPMLESLGVPFTFYLWTGRTEASNSVWPQAVKDGHEMGNHTASHMSTPPGGVQDINTATTFIMQHLGVTPYTMAAPNGSSSYPPLTASAHMMTNRGVSDAIVKPNDNTDPTNLPCYIPPMSAPASDFNSEVDSAQSGGGWRIILVHGFNGYNDSSAYQPVNLSDYMSGVDHTKSLGNMWIGRMVDVGSYWLGQKAISAATKTTSGSSTTYTWTLPANYPPGKYVRITVPGGTVTQNGATVPWDSHGFYEISVNAMSVTVGP